MKHNSEAYALVIEAKDILGTAYDIYHEASRNENVAYHIRELEKAVADMSYKISVMKDEYTQKK